MKQVNIYVYPESYITIQSLSQAIKHSNLTIYLYWGQYKLSPPKKS